ncbi:MAG TPA: acetate/propionate family kinase [Burkholderiales bacterium]|nr:acetate/propionate family kinase [Burkholderiales bacterium]
MSDAIVVINAGSSSIKFALYSAALDQQAGCIFRGQIDGLGANPRFSAWDADGNALSARPLPPPTDHALAVGEALDWLEDHDTSYTVVAAGHRVVHGGDFFSQPVRVDDAVLNKLQTLSCLAPLHQPHNIEGIRAVARHRPRLAQVACFDTEFHQSQPAIARALPLPAALTASGLKRYGFHGLSYEYIALKLPEMLGDLAGGRVVVAHLGNGASMCAMLAGKSVASTMGFTALDGLMMGTRSGAIDPGVLLHLLEQRDMTPAELSRLLYHESGLLGVSGLSHDMRTLLASSDQRAGFAIDLFVYRIVRELGSLAAALGGLDALVFTAGIGEQAAPVRAAVCEASAWLGVRLDRRANDMHETVISAHDSRVAVLVLSTDEEAMIARHALGNLSQG